MWPSPMALGENRHFGAVSRKLDYFYKDICEGKLFQKHYMGILEQKKFVFFNVEAQRLVFRSRKGTKIQVP